MGDHALVMVPSDPEQVEKGKQKAASAARRELNDLAFVASTVEGRRFLWHMIEKTHVYDRIATFDPIARALAEGERSIGLYLIQDLNAVDPLLYAQVRQEALKGEKQNA
jgi:hypothetical protein